MKSSIWCVLIFLFIFFASFNRVKALTISISGVSPGEVTFPEQEVSVTISITGLPSASFFRVAWQKSSGASYFGYMKNNSGDWVKTDSSQDCKNYFNVSDLSTTSLNLATKVGEENVIDNGSYTLKLRRYTSTCSSYTDSDPISIVVNFPTPTPSPSPSPTSGPTQTPTATPTSTPTSTPTKTPTPKPSPTKTPASTPTPTTSPEVLGETLSDPSSTTLPAVLGEAGSKSSDTRKFPFLPVILIGSGLSMVGLAVLQLINAAKGNKTDSPLAPPGSLGGSDL